VPDQTTEDRFVTTLMIELSDETLRLCQLKADASRMPLEKLVADTVEAAFQPERGTHGGEWDPSLGPDDIAAIEEGLAAADRGDFVPHEEAMAIARAYRG
jgi:hypothetical protein